MDWLDEIKQHQAEKEKEALDRQEWLKSEQQKRAATHELMEQEFGRANASLEPLLRDLKKSLGIKVTLPEALSRRKEDIRNLRFFYPRGSHTTTYRFHIHTVEVDSTHDWMHFDFERYVWRLARVGDFEAKFTHYDFMDLELTYNTEGREVWVPNAQKKSREERDLFIYTLNLASLEFSTQCLCLMSNPGGDYRLFGDSDIIPNKPEWEHLPDLQEAFKIMLTSAFLAYT
jgi:hypothetical protein